MTFLPIVSRELRVAARRRGTYRVRMAVALAAIVIGGCIFFVNLLAPPQKVGEYIFRGLAILSFLYCLASGRRSTADCLSEEKREGTLGLLFLTDLKGYDVVLGKLAATSLGGFYGLMAVFPVMAVPLLMGGITNGEFWRMVLVLVNTFLVSLAIGIFCSALSRDARKAMGCNLALLLLLTAGLPACAAVMLYFFPSRPLVPELFFSSPAYCFYLFSDTFYRFEMGHFWESMGVIHGLTWALVTLASWIAPRSWQDKPLPSRAEKLRWRDLWHAWSYGKAAKRAGFRKQLLDVNAFYWLAGRARLKPLHVWMFLGLTACWWTWGWVNSGAMWFDVSVSITTAMILNTTLKLWIALEAGNRLAEDQKIGAMELLLSTPLGVRDILRGQWLALRRQFLKPLLVVVVVELVLMQASRRYSMGNNLQFPITWFLGILMLVADVIALYWVAMWAALSAKNQNRATIVTFSRVLILPLAVFGVVEVMASLYSGLWSDTGWSPGWRFHLWWWFGLGIVADVAFGLMARRQLLRNFRQLATERSAPMASFLARWATRREARAKERAVKQSLTPGVVTARWTPRKAAIVGVTLVLLITCVLLIRERSQPKFPPPVVVSITQSNAPLRVFSGTGVFIVLPDGSLWRWGQTGGPQFPRAIVPEQVGTNCDWTQATPAGRHCVGLRKDGTIWEWGAVAALGSRGSFRVVSDPEQVETGHDWIQVSTGGGHFVALKNDGTLWVWGDNSWGQLGNGPGPNPTNLVQMGGDRDWSTVSCQGASTIGLRTNGTLWAWGRVYSSGNGPPQMNNVPAPTQICRETNWSSLTPGSGALEWNRSGEVWHLMEVRPPGAEETAASTGRLICSNSTPDHFASAFCGILKLFQVRSNGTLWESSYPTGFWPGTSQGAWRQVGKRSDWISIWGSGGTALGLTAEGTVWTWGVDQGKEPVVDFAAKLKRLQVWVMAVFGNPPGSTGFSPTQPYQEKPRPLMRLVPAATNPNGQRALVPP